MSKVSVIVGAGSCLLCPVVAGAVTNLAGGDMGLAAWIGAGVAGVLPLGATAIAAVATTALSEHIGKKSALAITGAFLGVTLLTSGIGAGVSAGTHKLTDFLKPKAVIEQQVGEMQK